MLRLLIIDDSAFVRKVMKEMLTASGDIDVVGTARNGEDALHMVSTLNPDVITCDLVMPEMDGVEFVKRQMRSKAVPILIVTASPQDAKHVLDALEAGAVDFVQKPSALATDNLRSVGAELIEKVKIAAQSKSGTVMVADQTVHKQTFLPAVPAKLRRLDAVVLGISTGGPQALRYLLPQFSPDFPVPLVIVLHMPVGYTAAFAEKLAELSKIQVKEAAQGDFLKAGRVLLAPAGRHITFCREKGGEVQVQLSIQPSNKPHRPSVDVMFKSAAEIFRNRVMGVVMTGMGDDGKEGSAWIKAQGGMILTEAESTCIIYGMPRSVVEAGLSDDAVPLSSMVGEINKRL